MPVCACTGPKITSFVPDDGRYNDKRTAGAWDTSENDVDNFLLDANYEWCDHTLSFVTGYVEYDTSETYDVDYTAAPILDDSRLSEDYDQFSQEIRLTSPGGETVDYIVGAFYQDSSLEFGDTINVPTDSLLRLLANPFAGISTRRVFEQDTEVWAAFGQATWNVTEAWRLILGARYTQEDKDGYRRGALRHRRPGGRGHGSALGAVQRAVGAARHRAEPAGGQPQRGCLHAAGDTAVGCHRGSDALRELCRGLQVGRLRQPFQCPPRSGRGGARNRPERDRRLDV